MQLTTFQHLALVAAALAGTSLAHAAQWEQEAAVLYYGESDGRVQDGSAKYRVTHEADNGDKVTVNAGFDALTGASPLGIAPSHQPQTITAPSGTIIHAPADSLPLDDRFKDARVSGGVQWDKSISEKWRHSSGITFSKEHDYWHMGVNSTASHTLNNKNTTLNGGLSLASDRVEAEGGKPIPLSLASSDREGNGHKTNAEIMLGVTQVLNKRAVAQLNYSYSQASGYLNDPYKYISITGLDGVIAENRFESRPDTRKGHNLYAALKYKANDKTTLSTSARLHRDDWGTDSITLEQKVRFELANGRSVEPHLRYYQQQAADFYTPQLLTGNALPSYASADYRLAKFDAYTLGATYRWPDKKEREWRVTGEYYHQKPAAVALTTGQANLNANPGFKAVMFSLGVKF